MTHQTNGTNGFKLLGWIPAIMIFAGVVGSFSVLKAQSEAVAKGLDRAELINQDQEKRLAIVETKLEYIKKGVDDVGDQNKEILQAVRKMGNGQNHN